MKITSLFNCSMPAMETLNEHINNLLKFLKAKRKTDFSKAQHKPEVSELLIRAQLLHRAANYHKFTKESQTGMKFHTY